MKKSIILLLALFLVGCTTVVDFVDPTDIEIVNLGDTDELVVGEEDLTLMAVISPSNAVQSVIWSSSDEAIAIVTDGVVTGLSSGIVTITATSSVKDTITHSIELVVIDNQIDLNTIEEIKTYLASELPDEANEHLILPVVIGDARLRWTSSDTNTINIIGRINRGRVDKHVTLQANITLGRVEGIFEKTIMVKKYELKSLADKKVTFTYLFDSGTNFTGFREGDLDKIDVINYSFGGITNGRVSVGGLIHYNQVIQAHEAGVRVVLAIGGWGVGGFSEASESQATRKIFIDSIIEAIDKYRFDGIDIDWEYPTNTAGGLIVGRPQDKANFTLLLKELREAMDAVDPDLILSTAVAAGAWAAENYYEVANISQYIDYLHVMTYDLINYSTFNTTHHTNMYPSQYSNSSAQAGVNAYVSRGMPQSKIIVGVAFYGHTFVTTSSGVNGMNATTSSRGSISYKNIVLNYLNNPNYTVYYDAVAKASWIYGNNTFITYDDPNSIKEKCDYVKANELGGIMVWEYNKDSDDSALLNAIYLNIQD